MQVVRILSSRDRNVLGLFIELLISLIINFSVGLFLSIVVFMARLPWLLASYKTSLVCVYVTVLRAVIHFRLHETQASGAVFYLVAVMGAVATIASFLLVLYGTAATAAYTVVSLTSGADRIRYDAPPQRLRRPHGD